MNEMQMHRIKQKKNHFKTFFPVPANLIADDCDSRSQDPRSRHDQALHGLNDAEKAEKANTAAQKRIDTFLLSPPACKQKNTASISLLSESTAISTAPVRHREHKGRSQRDQIDPH